MQWFVFTQLCLYLTFVAADRSRDVMDQNDVDCPRLKDIEDEAGLSPEYTALNSTGKDMSILIISVYTEFRSYSKYFDSNHICP